MARDLESLGETRPHALPGTTREMAGVLDEQQGHDGEEVGRGVEHEDGGCAARRVDRGADGRSDHARQVHLDRLQRDRTREVGLGHERRQDGVQGRRAERVADPDHQDAQDDERLVRVGRRRDDCEHDREDELLHLAREQQQTPVEDVGEDPADVRQDQQRTELCEEEDRDVGLRVRECEPVGAEQHVLHPGPDVRREHPGPDDAEVSVAQRRLRRATDQRAVAVDERVGRVLGTRLVRRHGADPTWKRPRLDGGLSSA